MNNALLQQVKSTFLSEFTGAPTLVCAPGRINVIGEHTDYNGGFVLPAAVGQAIYLAVAPSGHPTRSSMIAVDLGERHDFDVNEIAPLPPNSWQNYLLGVVAEITKSGKSVPGFHLVFGGDVPRGSGMSSSAALECGVCFGLNECFGLGFSKKEMIHMAQKAEHNYAGVMCGIMDQFASMMGAKDHALLLDCETLEFEHFPLLLQDYSLLLCNSNVHHNLASSEYNVRRSQCEAGVEVLQARYPDVTNLRRATMVQLNGVKEQLTEVVYRRCKYVIEENERVHTMTTAMRAGNLAEVGAILKKAQQAMQREYEISCPEIDFMADFANSRADVLGARMMGGGFGGCTINLVQKGNLEIFVQGLNSAYEQQFGKQITPIAVTLSDGVRLIA